MSETYYKFLNKGRVGPYSGWKWPRVKQWCPEISGELVKCSTGYHVCREQDVLKWLAAEAYEAEAAGVLVVADDKVVTSRARLVRRIKNWNKKTARLFVADCAEVVLPIFAKVAPNDDRPSLAIKAARDYAHGRIGAAAWAAAGAAAGEAAWEAAWAAARAAARAAAGEAAWEAAWAAARAAARAAAGEAAWAAAWEAAWAAAGEAAWAAAWEAAREAAWDWQRERLFLYFNHGEEAEQIPLKDFPGVQA